MPKFKQGNGADGTGRLVNDEWLFELPAGFHWGLRKETRPLTSWRYITNDRHIRLHWFSWAVDNDVILMGRWGNREYVAYARTVEQLRKKWLVDHALMRMDLERAE